MSEKLKLPTSNGMHEGCNSSGDAKSLIEELPPTEPLAESPTELSAKSQSEQQPTESQTRLPEQLSKQVSVQCWLPMGIYKQP